MRKKKNLIPSSRKKNLSSKKYQEKFLNLIVSNNYYFLLPSFRSNPAMIIFNKDTEIYIFAGMTATNTSIK
jgi:hypothetical protein